MKRSTSIIKGFTSQSGKTFDAKLTIKADNTIGFEFPERLKYPVCGKEMINSCNDTKGIIMAIRYNNLWKKLIDENMMKVDLRDQAGITTNALAKLGKNEHVSTQVLEKVCKVLHCEIQDIMEFVPDEEREEK